jgi:NADP-dependent 3-hydroxy acid dehydrogenase YdfG
VAGRLAGRVAIVTGASSGIGAATALALADEGAAVTLVARRADRLEEVRRALAHNGATAIAIEADVSNEASCRAAVERTRAHLGGLDIVVNNAGVMLLGPIVDADTEDWRRMLDANVFGVLYMTHAALPLLLDHGGDIVNVSSVAGRVARRGSGVYNASKWAVNAFSESLRQEVTTRGVRISLVEPGFVETELRDHITHVESKKQAIDAGTAMHVLQAADIASAIIYIVTQPRHVAINEMLVRPTDQER